MKPTHHLLLGSARWYYQRYALATEHVDEEIRLLLAGQHSDLRRLTFLQKAQDAAWERLRPYLSQISSTVRRKDSDGEGLQEYLTTAAQKIAQAGRKTE